MKTKDATPIRPEDTSGGGQRGSSGPTLQSGGQNQRWPTRGPGSSGCPEEARGGPPAQHFRAGDKIRGGPQGGRAPPGVWRRPEGVLRPNASERGTKSEVAHKGAGLLRVSGGGQRRSCGLLHTRHSALSGTSDCQYVQNVRSISPLPPHKGPMGTTAIAVGKPPALCDISSGCCFFPGPWTVPRSSLRMLRRVAAFCGLLRPMLLLVPFPRSRSPVVGVLGLLVPFPRSWSPVVGVPGLCWL